MTENEPDLLGIAMDIALETMDEKGSHPDFLAALTDWLRHDANGDQTVLLHAEDAPMMACQLSRAIWSLLPNPNKGFRIERIASPGRNDACISGLDCKHKQCCANVPSPPPLPPEIGWLFLVEALEEDELDDLLASGRLPDGLLGKVAGRLLDGAPERVVDLIAPRFKGAVPSTTHADELLMLLADALEELGRTEEKFDVFERMAEKAKGPLQASACQRLASMHADRGAFDKVWHYFGKARRADPEDLALSHLEVSLLLTEGRVEEAKLRARHWLAVLERLNPEGAFDTPINWLKQVISTGSMLGANAAIAMSDTDAWTRRFIQVAENGLARPVNAELIRAVDPAAADETQGTDDAASLEKRMIAHLRGIGFKPAEARKEAKKVAAVMASQLSDQPDAVIQQPQSGNPGRPERQLASSQALAEVERAWHNAWPVPKPFATQALPGGDIPLVWEEPAVAFWIEFLETNPLAFDSLDVLDDLVIGIALIAGEADWQAVQPVRERILERARNLMQPFFEQDLHLNWGFAENRPGLRLLVARALEMESQAGQALHESIAELLRLNPGDNHGLREIAMSELLRMGDDAGALLVTDQYPDDRMPALAYGQALALFRLGRTREADAALSKALKHAPKVGEWLLKTRCKQPELSEFGVTMGGNDEAWLYRDAMRPTWEASPGAMDWLRSALNPK